MWGSGFRCIVGALECRIWGVAQVCDLGFWVSAIHNHTKEQRAKRRDGEQTNQVEQALGDKGGEEIFDLDEPFVPLQESPNVVPGGPGTI